MIQIKRMKVEFSRVGDSTWHGIVNTNDFHTQMTQMAWQLLNYRYYSIHKKHRIVQRYFGANLLFKLFGGTTTHS